MTNVEVVLETGRDVMSLAQQRRNLLAGGFDLLGASRGAHDIVEPGLELADDASARGRPRHHYGVVLILPRHRLALRREHTDHGELRRADPDPLAEWIFVADQFLHD